MFYMEEQNQFVLSVYTYIENVYTYDAPVEEFARIAGEEISSRTDVSSIEIKADLPPIPSCIGFASAKICFSFSLRRCRWCCVVM